MLLEFGKDRLPETIHLTVRRPFDVLDFILEDEQRPFVVLDGEEARSGDGCGDHRAPETRNALTVGEPLGKGADP